MRPPRRVTVALQVALQGAAPACAALAAAPLARAQPDPGADVDPVTQQARRHFRSGLKLYQDANYGGALAEFEAAYRTKPTASSLKNVALCQKALFRYAEAAATLEQVLARHGAELADAERGEVRAGIDELRALVGSLVVRVRPPDARVSIDGRALAAHELGASLSLNVGEHTLSAEAPGHETLSRIVRVAGGQKDVPVELELRPTTGFLSVTAGRHDAAIAVDGVARAFHHWRGPLAPGRHYVQVYKEGWQPTEQVVNVVLGRTEELRLELGPKLAADERPRPPGDRSPPQQGVYALGVLSALNVRGNVEDLPHDETGEASGFSAGARAGYRLWTPVGVEALIELGRSEVKDACDEAFLAEPAGEGLSCDAEAARRSYQIESFRFGPNLRLFSSGEKLRATVVVGTGAVRHQLDLEPKDGRSGGSVSGIDPYFLLEFGGQANFGHLVLELGLDIYIDSTAKLNGSLEGRPDPYRGTGLVFGGLGLRGGWSEWAPGRTRVEP